jgi:hypothetical protein
MRQSLGVLLGLKALVYHPPTRGFVSPSYRSLKWGRSGWVEAICEHRLRRCFQAPGKGCTCGIYAANHRRIVLRYASNPDAVTVLVMACGEVEVWSAGFRAQAVQVVGVIDLKALLGLWDDCRPDLKQALNDRMALTGMLATEHFGVELIELEVGLKMVETSWLMEGYVKVKEEYDTAETVRVS